MGPEDNPADDVQPTKEEWEAYEANRNTPGPCTHCASMGRPNIPMELNGLRFVCASPMGDTRTVSIDDFPVYAAAPDLLAACEAFLMFCAGKSSRVMPERITREAIAKAKKGK